MTTQKWKPNVDLVWSRILKEAELWASQARTHVCLKGFLKMSLLIGMFYNQQ